MALPKLDIDLPLPQLKGRHQIDNAGNAIAAVRKASVNPRVGILVGGPLFNNHPELATELGADAVAVDGSLAPDIAVKLVETRVSPC